MEVEAVVDASTVRLWLEGAAASVREQRDYLTQLDAAIGDADHGTNMDRGFASVVAKLVDLDDGREPAIHVRPVICVADRSVELRQVVTLLTDRGGRFLEPAPYRARVHDRLHLHRTQTPQRSAGVCTGASHSAVSSSSSASSVIETPAISRLVM